MHHISPFCRRAGGKPKLCSADPQGGYLYTAAAFATARAAFYATAKCINVPAINPVSPNFIMFTFWV